MYGRASRKCVPWLTVSALFVCGTGVLSLRSACLSQRGTYNGKPVDHWVMRLGDVDPKVRQEAAYALWEIGPAAKGAIRSLIGSLNDEDPGVQVTAIYALRKIDVRAPAVRSALLEIVRTGDPEVHFTSDILQQVATLALVDIGEEVLPDLLLLLEDGDAGARYGAAFGLARFGVRAQAALPRLLWMMNRDPDSDVREAAVWAVCDIGRPAHGVQRLRVVEGLIHALQDEDPYVRASACRELQRFGTSAKDGVPSLAGLLKDSDGSVRVAAALALWRIAPEQGAVAIAALKTVLTEGRFAPEREQAANALGDMGRAAQEAVPALKEALKDQVESVRNAAERALKQIRASKGRGGWPE